jgi:hypothetical protein
VVLYGFIASIGKWNFILPLLIAVPLSLALMFSPLLRDELKSYGVRSCVLFLLAALPPFAYGRGVLQANDLVTGRSFNYIAIDLPHLTPASGTEAGQRPRYVGLAGDRYVVFDPLDKSISFIAAGEVKILKLKRYDAPPKSEVQK